MFLKKEYAMSEFLLCWCFLVVISNMELVKSEKQFKNSLKTLIEEDADEIRRGNFIIKFPEHKTNVRRQQHFPSSYQFPCFQNTTTYHSLPYRSVTRPISVHRLRPGDIDVVAAMGDSLIAGNGALEEWALGTMIEYRGVSWCAGGQGTWREYLTLPNILKVFNPNITGYSTGTGEFLSAHARLNVAYPVSADADALRQAKILVSKMRRDPGVDVENDWKMVTLFFGANDLCSAQCFDGNEESSSNMHIKKLQKAIDYLQEKLPRTFVNLIPVLDVSVSIRIKRTMMCKLLHSLFCTCFHRGGNEMDIITKLTKEYQKAEEDLVQSGRYDHKEDFTVVLQPFMKLFNAPDDPVRKYDEVIDISYITHDCFHFSQKGHALAANLLWNNLLQPVGRKSQVRINYFMEKFECPKENSPFFFTNLNSKTFFEYGHQ